ncbi:MAG: metallophosphoesterase family protein [Rhizobiaceae bacterium]
MFLGTASLPAGSRIYAVGDIHGRLDCLERLFKEIGDDIEARPIAKSRIVLLGDYVDRGPDSRGVIDFLISVTGEFELVCLRGNHDDRLLGFVDAPDEFSGLFLRYGGWKTLASYGVTVPRLDGDVENMSKSMAKNMPDQHKQFLAGLPHYYSEEDYFFCHAGVRPGVDLKNQDPEDLMWIRDDFLSYQGSFGKVIIHGHTPHRQVEILPNRINLDTMAFHSGKLSCAVLENDTCKIIQTDL